jgi:hypothetical protein
LDHAWNLGAEGFGRDSAFAASRAEEDQPDGTRGGKVSKSAGN